MKIIFLCGSLEPGCDGVGDYTRRLAGELNRQGYEAAVVALNDTYCIDSYNGEQKAEGSIVKVFRLGANIPEKKRFYQAKLWINNYDPVWLSLQFVPFSFHAKGLPFMLHKQLIALGEVRRWHVMFHELWVTDFKKHSVSKLLMRELQKNIIKNLLKTLEFEQIDTSNTNYYRMLKSIGYESNIFPIFSNVPKGQKKVISCINDRSNTIIGVLFGHIQHNSQAIEKIKILTKWIKEQINKELCIIHIGNNRNNKTHQFLNELSAIVKQVHSFGFLDANDAADVLASADFGLSNYPSDLIQKSGSIASMLYNELPVILLSSNQNNRELSVPGVVQIEHISDINEFINQEKKFSKQYSSQLSVEKLHRKFSLFKSIR